MTKAVNKMARAWAHLHLPRLRSGSTPAVISLKVPGHKIQYVSAVELTDVEFRVHEAGRQRCLRDNVRNVHAWVVGEVSESTEPSNQPWQRAIYDPWKGDSFVSADTLEPVQSAARAVLVGKDVWYQPAESGDQA